MRVPPGGLRNGVLFLLVTTSAAACTVVGYPAGAPTATAPAAAREGPEGRSAGSDGGAEPAAADPGRETPRAAPDFRRDGPPENDGGVDLDAIPDAVPVEEPLAPSGNMSEYEVDGHTYHVRETSEGYEAEGVASWYGREFHGRSTSSGEPYDMYAMTAAHRTLPLPTYLEVVNLDNGRRVVVRVNDRGPFHDDRLIDLSYAAAWRLGMIGNGTAHVRIRALEPAAR